MSYMIATPAALTAAATDIDGIGSAVSVANAAAVAATTGVLAAGGDEVLAAIARLFNANAEEYHALSAQVAAFQTLFVRTLTGGCGVFRRREAANASQLQSIARQVRGAVNAVAGQVTGNGGSGNSGTSAAAANPNSDNTASIADRGTSAIMTTASATASSTGVDGGIAATYAVASQWDGGYVANYTITQFGRDFDDRLAVAIHFA